MKTLFLTIRITAKLSLFYLDVCMLTGHMVFFSVAKRIVKRWKYDRCASCMRIYATILYEKGGAFAVSTQTTADKQTQPSW